MNPFVEVCRKEWGRLGVPEGMANEMATDLDADLAEAAADGVSPEAVLGNGYFDATSFAAEWAMARGFVRQRFRHVPEMIRLKSLGLAVSAACCLIVGAVGFVILIGVRVHAASAAALSFGPFVRPIAGSLIRPGPFGFGEPGRGFQLLGLALLLLAVVGLGVTVWLWRRWSPRSNPPESYRSVGLPSFL